MVLLDSTFNETKSQNHPYYRIIRDYKSEKATYVFNDYSISGILMTEGTSSNKDHIVKEGGCTYYYTTGAKRKESHFVKDRLEGKESKWYENGNKKEEGEYFILDEKVTKPKYKINQFWNKDGVKKVTNGNGEYEESSKKIFGKGTVKNGVKDGEWKGWVDKPEIKYTENYKDGQFISGKTVDENNIETVYDVLEKKPEPKNGIKDFYSFIAKNYRMPNTPDLKGKIYITFIVDKDGKILEPKILRDIGYGTGAEAIRVLMNCENWNPGELKGQKVRASYSLPITIQSAK